MNKSLTIKNLGAMTLQTPIKLLDRKQFVSDQERLLVNPSFLADHPPDSPQSAFEVAGPRENIFFSPKNAIAGIVTCGGLSPGLNAVVRSLVVQLWERYGCRSILGIKGGYHGLSQAGFQDHVKLTPASVEDIHSRGGTILRTSRGTPDTKEMADVLADSKIQMLFVIGGDGTMRGAHALTQELELRGHEIAVVGIPKTIDNDIQFVRRTFGFETAVDLASSAVRAAYVESSSVRRGLGIVKLMGRDSGYIAANATLASGVADFCLIPENDFKLEKLFSSLEERLAEKEHSVIVVAEGAGQKYFSELHEVDASGNKKLGDIGLYLKQKAQEYFAAKEKITVKYIDPSYMIRACAANPADQLFCARLAQNAVHAAICGKTDLLIGYWHGRMTHVPLAILGSERQRINPKGELWFNVLESTGQPLNLSA